MESLQAQYVLTEIVRVKNSNEDIFNGKEISRLNPLDTVHSRIDQCETLMLKMMQKLSMIEMYITSLENEKQLKKTLGIEKKPRRKTRRISY